MKKWEITALFLTLALLGACGAPAGPEPESVTPDEPASFGTTVTQSVPEELETQDSEPAPTMEAREEEPFFTEADGAVDQSVPEMDRTEDAVISAVAAAYLDGSRYDPMEPGYFWRAVAFLVIRLGEDAPGAEVDDLFIRVPAETVDLLVEGLFGLYEGQYPSLGEENPYLAEEYRDGESCYVVTRRDLSDLVISVSEPEPEGDGWVCMVEAEKDGMNARQYRVTLTPGSGSLFSRFISALEPLDRVA